MKLEFLPGALGKPKRYEIVDGVISELDENGRARAVFQAAAAQHARWHQIYAKFFVKRALELSAAHGKQKLSLVQVMPAHMITRDRELAAYLRAVSAVLSAVAEAKPELEVKIEQPRLMRWLLFTIYVGAIVGIGVLISALLGGRHASKLWWAAVVLGGAAVFSAFMAWRNRPWQTVERITARELASSLMRQIR
jgi:hypothetical protein